MDNTKKKFICNLVSLAIVTVIVFMVTSLILETIQLSGMYNANFSITAGGALSNEFYSKTSVLSIFLIIFALAIIVLELIRMVDDKLRKLNLSLLIAEIVIAVALFICVLIVFSLMPIDLREIYYATDYLYYMTIQTNIAMMLLFTIMGIIASCFRIKFTKAALIATAGGNDNESK